MKEFKGTPGPYRVEEFIHQGKVFDFNLRGDPSASQPIGPIIANVGFVDTPDNCHVHGIEAARANAQLLAAAPELLDAIIYALPYLEAAVTNPRNGVNADCSVDVNCVDRARAAIAKATGSEA